MEKKESPKRERAVKPVISLPSEKWIVKIGFLRVHTRAGHYYPLGLLGWTATL